MTLSVKSIVGEVCMTRADGQKLHDSFRPLLDGGERVILDFSGVRVFVSAFFNAAFGQLLEKYTKQDLSKKLRFVHVPASAATPLRKSIEMAEKYYREPNYRLALDKVLTTQSELV